MSRTMTLSAAILVLIGLALDARPTAAQDTAGLAGQINDTEGKPYAEVTVTLKRTDIGLTYNAKTDKNGNYSFTALRPGSYYLSIRDNGQVVFNMVCTVRQGSDNSLNLNLKQLMKKEDKEDVAAVNKQLREREAFQGMNAHFDAGLAKFEQAQQLRAEITKTPIDRRVPLQEKLDGLYQSALTEFQESQRIAPEKDPNLHIVWYRIGDTCDKMGKYQEAADAYQNAIARKPDVAVYHNNLGNVLAKLGKIREAGEAYEKSATLDPANAAVAWFNLGVVLHKANRFTDAAEPLRKAITLDPKNAEGWYLLANSLLAAIQTKQEGDKLAYIIPPGTVEAFQKYLQLAPNGRFAGDARAALQSLKELGAGTELKVNVKKDKN